MPLQGDLQGDLEFRKLSPEAKQLFFQRNDPDFAALSPQAQKLFVQRMGPPQTSTLRNVASGVLDKFGLAGPGPIESIFGAPKGEGIASKALGVVDPALQVLGSIPMGVGRAVGDITELGGAAVGTALNRIPGVKSLIGPSATEPTPTWLSNIAGMAGMFLAPGGGVVPRPVRSPTRVQEPIAPLSGPEPAAPVPQPSKRPFGVNDPVMVQSTPIAPPIQPGAPGQGLPLLMPGIEPTQVEVGMANAGMRGPGLLSATDQPLITSAPARTGRGTSEIVDEFGHRIPTRPPQHIDPADAMMPPAVTGPLPGRLPGELSSATEIATRKVGMTPTGKPPTSELRGFEQFYQFPFVPVKASTAVGGVAGAVAGGGIGDTPEERARNAIIGMVTGAAAPTAIGRWNARMGKQLDWANRVDMEIRASQPLTKPKEAHKIAAGLPRSPLSPPTLQDTVAAINDTLTAHGVTQAPVSRTTQRLIRIGQMSAEAPLSLSLAKEINKNPAIVPTLSARLQARGSSLMDVAQLMVDSGRKPADLLARASGLSRVLEHEMLSNPQAAKLLRAVIDDRPVMTPMDAAGHLMLRNLNAWRGLLVSALDTALRNTGVQQARIGIEALELTIENAIATAAGVLPKSPGVLSAPERSLTAGSRYFWEYLVGWASPRARAQVDRVLEAYPAFKDKLFSLYASDVSQQMRALGPGLARVKGGELRPMGPIATQADRAIGVAEIGVKGANAANRFQEVMTRKIDFRAWLLELLHRRGINDLDNIPVSQLKPEELAQSVTHGLRMTFAESPSRKAPGVMERTFAGILDITGKSAMAAASLHVGAGQPFVRFTWNAGRFISERPYTMTTPALRTLWRLLQPSEHAAIVRGDLNAVSRTMTGWAGLLGAWQFVNSEYAGDGLLEVKTPAGSFKLNTLGPILPAYVWVAQFVKHYNEGTLVQRWPEFAREAAMMRHRAEDLLLGADRFIQDAPSIIGDITGDPASAGALGEAVRPGRFIGETAAASLQFLTSVQRLFAAYGKHIPELEAAAQEENIKRDTRGGSFSEALTNPIQARIPVVARQLGIPTMADLPPQTSALRAGNIPLEVPPTTPGGFPLPSNLIGIKTVPPRTPAERAALIAGLKPREIAGQPTQFPGADRLVRREIGALADPALSPFVDAPGFKVLSPKIKAYMLSEAIAIHRETAREALQARIDEKLAGGQGLTPEEREFFDVWLKTQFDPRMRDLMREKGGKVPR